VDFTWDPRKAAGNARKHGITFEEAATVFADPLALVVQDEVHAERTVLIGQSGQHRVLLVMHVELDEDTIRLVSARRATSHERRRYEEGP
jgi:hypothetical protein